MDTAGVNAVSPDEPTPGGPAPSALRWSWPARLALMFTGVVLPILCFAISYPEQPAWQSGNLDAYAQLLLSHKPSLPLYPFLLYSMTCMTLLVFAPDRFVSRFVVRFGIYTGVPLAAQCWLVFIVALGGTGPKEFSKAGLFSLFAGLITWLIGWGLVLLCRRTSSEVFWSLAALILLAAIFLAPASASLCLFCATPWAVAAYSVAAIYAARHSGAERLQFTLAQLLAVLTWLAAYLGAWRTSVLLMLQEYAKLPTTPPQQCYVATAAAHGHRRLVGAESYAVPWGTVYRVNDQMRYLKAAELLLAVLCPPAHRVCRRVYDRIGPLLAATLIHPLLADAAYLSLKPAEWLARAALALLLPGDEELIHRLYGPDPERPSTCSTRAPGKPGR